MASLEINYFSKTLGTAMSADVILPEGQGGGPFPTLYLLHGLTGDNSSWKRQTSIERYVRELPLIVVMPNAGRSFYCNAIAGPRMETAIIKDLIPFVDCVFRTKDTREGRCIGGLSMGGYGALKLALKYPDLFSSAASHSGALGFAYRPINRYRTPEFQEEFASVIGSDSTGGPEDLFALAQRLPSGRRPRLRVDCGVDDLHLEDNRAFGSHLKALDFGHDYFEFPGGHNWDYWDLHVPGMIAFHARNLGLQAKS